jgi:hypothetical protein
MAGSSGSVEPCQIEIRVALPDNSFKRAPGPQGGDLSHRTLERRSD